MCHLRNSPVDIGPALSSTLKFAPALNDTVLQPRPSMPPPGDLGICSSDLCEHVDTRSKTPHASFARDAA